MGVETVTVEKKIKSLGKNCQGVVIKRGTNQEMKRYVDGFFFFLAIALLWFSSLVFFYFILLYFILMILLD
jgi:hypothetical protein